MCMKMDRLVFYMASRQKRSESDKLKLGRSPSLLFSPNTSKLACFFSRNEASI